MDERELREAALEYHRAPTPGKISVVATKGLTNQHDLSLAYSPGVAYACLAIKDDPQEAATLTSRANLVAVITNGTAVLGLGNIGPLASKPVMEGKGCLFKKFAGIDVFDIEIDADRPRQHRRRRGSAGADLRRHQPGGHQGAGVLHRRATLRERMKIPVFHDDQHGTAIIVSAAILNGLKLVGKDIAKVKVAVLAAPGRRRSPASTCWSRSACGASNILVSDIKGVVYKGRTEEMDPEKARYAQDTKARTLAEIVPGADVFLGLSAGGVLKPEMIAGMAPQPADPGARQPGARDPARTRHAGRGPTPSSAPAARTTPTRSTTCCASPSSSAARSTWAPPPSTRR